MNNIRTFWHIFKNSLLNINWYRNMLGTRVKLTTKYYFGLVFIMALGSTIIAAPNLITTTMKTVKEALAGLDQAFPEDLVVEIKDGQWTINKEEPYTIENFVILNHEGTINDLQNSEAFVLVNSNNILLKEQNNISSTTLQGLQDGTINKERYAQQVHSLSIFARLLPAILVSVYLAANYIGNIVLVALYIMVVTFISWLVLGILSLTSEHYSSFMDFRAIFRVVTHTMTWVVLAGLIIELAYTATGYTQPTLIPLFLLAQVCFSVYVIYRLNMLES